MFNREDSAFKMRVKFLILDADDADRILETIDDALNQNAASYADISSLAKFAFEKDRTEIARLILEKLEENQVSELPTKPTMSF